MKISEYIMTILRSSPVIVFSWGFNHPQEKVNGLRFGVNGMIYQGEVEVIYNEDRDSFSVRLVEEETIKEQVDDVYLGELVPTIDRLVESGNDDELYKKQVNEWLNNEIDIDD